MQRGTRINRRDCLRGLAMSTALAATCNLGAVRAQTCSVRRRDGKSLIAKAWIIWRGLNPRVPVEYAALSCGAGGFGWHGLDLFRLHNDSGPYAKSIARCADFFD